MRAKRTPRRRFAQRRAAAPNWGPNGDDSAPALERIADRARRAAALRARSGRCASARSGASSGACARRARTRCGRSGTRRCCSASGSTGGARPRDDLRQPRRRADRAGSRSSRLCACARLHVEGIARARRAGSSRRCARASAPRSRPTARAGRAAARSRVSSPPRACRGARSWRSASASGAAGACAAGIASRSRSRSRACVIAYSEPIWMPREGGSDAEYLAPDPARDGPR